MATLHVTQAENTLQYPSPFPIMQPLNIKIQYSVKFSCFSKFFIHLLQQPDFERVTERSSYASLGGTFKVIQHNPPNKHSRLPYHFSLKQLRINNESLK